MFPTSVFFGMRYPITLKYCIQVQKRFIIELIKLKLLVHSMTSASHQSVVDSLDLKTKILFYFV